MPRKRIPDVELERIKREVPITELCRRYGVELKKERKDFVGLCPFHDEKTASFKVSPDKNLWNCLGRAGCGGGDNIQFVMRMEKVSFLQAVDILRRMLGEASAVEEVKTKAGTTFEILAKPDESTSDRELLGRVVDFYHQTFCNDSKAMKYLEKRCCFHPEAVKTFKIGFANRTLGYRVPLTTSQGKKLKARLTKLGVFRKESGHEHLNGSVVFPLLDRDGNVVQFYGRKITEVLRPGTPKHLYMEGSLQEAVFNVAGIVDQREVILCESILDALTFWTAGIRNVTCLLGVRNFTAALWATLEQSRPRRVILCFDNDAAGNEAFDHYSPMLAERLPEASILRARLPEGEDINSYACQSSNAAAALAALLEGAQIVRKTAGESNVSIGEQLFSLVAEAAAEPTAEEAPIAPEPGIEATCAPVDGPKPSPKESEPAAEELPPTLPEPPEPAASDINTGPDEQTYMFGLRAWRVRGMACNLSYGSLKIHLRVLIGAKNSERYHADTLDMCNAKHRDGFVERAHRETGLSTDLLKRDMAQLYLKLEDLQAENIRKATEPQKPVTVELSDEARKEAIEYLKAPNLRQRLLADYKACGVVGEETPLEVCHYAALTRVFEKPLGVIIQSSTAAGKSTLMDANLAFIPEESKIKYSAMTGQALFYLGETNIQNKVLAIAEEEGAERATYALKLLLSDGEVSIASVGKDPATGRMTTEVYCSKGPTQVIFATTAVEIEEELANRCMIVAVDESREQTRRIHEQQAFEETTEGYLAAKKRKKIRELHQNVQRVLKNIPVHNPYARLLTFPVENTRLRRDKKKYLTLIRAIAFFHQYQRKLVSIEGEEHILVDIEDIAIANELCGKVFGQSLDEMAPQTRRFLNQVWEMTRLECAQQGIEQKEYRFGQREVREFTGLTARQVKRHVARLAELEYVMLHRSRRGQTFTYELVYHGEGRDGGKFVLGLLDVKHLREKQLELNYDGKWSPQNGEWSPSGPPQVPAMSPLGPIEKIAVEPCIDEASRSIASKSGRKPHNGEEKSGDKTNHSNSCSNLAAERENRDAA